MIYSPKKSKIDIFLDEQYAKVSDRNKLLGIGLFVVLVAGLFFFVFYQPNQEEIDRLTQQASAANEELRKVRKAAQDLPRHKKELEEVRLQFETTSTLLPKSQEIPNLLRNISDLGRSSGLDFISFTPGQEIPKDFYAEIPIDIKIRGPYHNLGLFLDKVSKLERIVTVNNIKTEKVDLDKNEILLSSSCRLITYRFTNVKLEQKKK
ncbi:MAG: type 4a pilus biogenesis protein PilO [Desulfobulbus sp.]|jgi:type IV pilus assembly protein PilO|uniref:type 4a pilus biogenesis protein PilO n=1 Tax=Desulfobulbus sp. TaxID=895 RepID=UPI002846BDD3|nr:type 4a pilus biogenesis protein PilO [Desulfobulbus sp.]MDR2549667.1 type 4a pilus biogenesis protein PilO [Desulfobulbus sp.]